MERLKVRPVRGRIVLTIDGRDCKAETGLRFRRNYWGTMFAIELTNDLNAELARDRGHRWYRAHLPKIAACNDTMPGDDGLRIKKYALRMRMLAREARA